MDHHGYETLELSYDGDLAVLTLKRPELLNCIDLPSSVESKRLSTLAVGAAGL